MQIIDNFLDEETFSTISNVFYDDRTEWRYIRYVSSVKNEEDGAYFIRDVCIKNRILCNSYEYLYHNYLTKLEDFNELIRLRYVMYLKTDKIMEHGKHTDYPFPHKGALLYLNTNNGFTRLDDGTKIESVANRLVLHDASEYHNSSTCTDEDARAVLVCNYV